MNGERCLIVNADDFGASDGINRGIVDCHRRGVVTSTSLMVFGRSAREAAAMSLDNPGLSVGLHWDVWGEDEREFDLGDLAASRDEFRRQLDKFCYLMGRLPTHVDSHKHAHLEGALKEAFGDWAAPLGVPVRRAGMVRFVGGFYAQWEWMITDLEHVSVPFLQHILREEVGIGWTEIGCHPGYLSPDFRSVYLREREAEAATLTDPRIRQTIDELGIRLASYADYVSGHPAGAFAESGGR